MHILTKWAFFGRAGLGAARKSQPLDASQLLPRCLQDASQTAPGFLPDALRGFQMIPDALSFPLDMAVFPYMG